MPAGDPAPRPTLAGDPAPGRVLAGGFLMGLANLVPGVSGGTMILALGLYDRFIGAVAELSSFRWSKRLFVFLALVGAGLVVAILGFSGLAVELVTNHRWVMYSLFIGMTLGGVPELLKLTKPFRPQEILAAVAGLGGMAWLAYGMQQTELDRNFVVFVAVGALAASSMILPGISGSYILLILGLYEVVVGSASSSALREDFSGSLAVLVPIGIGAALGIALLSNVLKFFLTRFRGPSHALLLGLLLGSVLGLWPFQEAVHAELGVKARRKAVALLVQGKTTAEIEAERGFVFEPGEAELLGETYAGKSPGELKRLAEELEFFDATAGQGAASLGLVLLGFLLTRLIGVREKQPEGVGGN